MSEMLGLSVVEHSKCYHMMTLGFDGLIKTQWAAGLSWLENTCSRPFFSAGDLTRKVGQTDLVYGLRSGFISRSVHARLQVSVCSGYDLCHPG